MEPKYKVGDIVLTRNEKQKKTVAALVTNIDGDWSVNIMFADGTYGFRLQTKVRPTDRHIDIQGILDSIK